MILLGFESGVRGSKSKEMPLEAGKVKETDFSLKLPGKMNSRRVLEF